MPKFKPNTSAFRMKGSPLLKDINNLRFGIPLGTLPFVDTGEAPQ